MRKSLLLLALLIPTGAQADPLPQYRAYVEQRTAHMFDLADRNHDGVLTRDEYVAACVAIAKARGGTPTDKGLAIVRAQFDAVDASHSGRIPRADFIAEKMTRFDAMDLNRDGIVSANEARKAATRLRAEAKGERVQGVPPGR
jgi:Ca2+-binding EF-hand superfamily protein